jgi:hypothetical protein
MSGEREFAGLFVRILDQRDADPSSCLSSKHKRRRQRWPPIRDGQALSIPRGTLVNVA